MQKEEIQFDLDFEIDDDQKKIEFNEYPIDSNKEDGEISFDEIDQPDDHESSPNDKANNNQRKNNYRQIRNNYSRTLFVGDLSKDITHNNLTEIFSNYGKIIDIDIKYLKFGVTTYAFIQFIDPLCALSAYHNEQNRIIDKQKIKVGFGRSSPSDTLWIGGLSQNELDLIIEKIHEMQGLRWILNDIILHQSICKFNTLSDCSIAFEWTRSLKEYKGLLSDFLSFYAYKNFISRTLESGQKIDSLILNEVDRRPTIHRERSRRSSDNTEDFDNYYNKHKNDTYKSLKKRKISFKNFNSSNSENNSSSTSYNSIEDYKKYDKDILYKSKIWSGKLLLKSKIINVSFYYFKGNRRVFDACLCDVIHGHKKVDSLKIAQRMKLENEQINLINQRIKNGDDTAFAIVKLNDTKSQENEIFKNDFIKYFYEKDAAGVIQIFDFKHNEMTHILYLFPPCNFVSKHTKDLFGNLRTLIEHESYLLILAVRCN